MAQPTLQQVQQAYEHCMQQVRRHYENFPVASLLLPKHLRRPISAIYAFARNADDFADEGDWDEQTRLARLNAYSNNLDNLENTTLDDPVFIALADTISKHQLPVGLFHDLLHAFKQDVVKKRYDNFEQVLDYCRHSANPIGRLLLYLVRENSADNLRLSDSVCSALQLINFLQDIEQDYVENNRIYLPRDEMQRFGVNEDHIINKRCDDALQQLLNLQVERAGNMLCDGAVLGNNIGGRFGLQLRAMIHGGFKIVHYLKLRQGDCFARPRLAKSDWLLLGWNALWRITPPQQTTS
jgi:squalene synthase HpnC